MAVSVEERNGNLENANEREPRRLLSDGENVAARMMETLIAQLADPTSPSIDAGLLINRFDLHMTMERCQS